jgi:hypothetical protein
MHRPAQLTSVLALLAGMSTASAFGDSRAYVAVFDPEIGPNQYTLTFPPELGGAVVYMPITGGRFVLEVDADGGTSSLASWRQDVEPIVLFGASTGPITITLDESEPSSGTFDAATGAFSVEGTFRIEFDDSSLRQLGFISPVTLRGTEEGTIHAIEGVEAISMELAGSGQFAGGTFAYTCQTTARVESGLTGDQAQVADANHDRRINLADAVSILNGLFIGDAIPCPAAADVNGDRLVDISDAIFLLGYLFLGGAAPSTDAVPCEATDA